MKKLATLVLAFMISGFAFGQDGQQRRVQKTPEESAKLYTERLTKELNLSSEQQNKVYELTLERTKAPRERGKMNKGRMEEMRKERQEQQTKLESILTPEQVKIWNESRKASMNNRRDQFKRKPGMRKQDSNTVRNQKQK